MSDQALLRDLIEIPDRVHAGDFVLALAKGVGRKSTIDDYVVTDALADDFDRALGLIKTALETQSSRAAYLDGSFGSGKSHFMAVLYAILRGDPDARGKQGLADVVARHDSWLAGREFLLVPYHLPDSKSLDAAILGGYVSHVLKNYPGKPLPAVYRDDELLEDAKELRQAGGDDAFIAQLPAGDDEWGTASWDSVSLDHAFSEPPGGEERRRLIGALLAGPFHRYVNAVRAEQESFITLDEGLSVISRHAKNVLGCDAVVLLLDELVLWLAGYIGDPKKVSLEAQKVSKLIESAEFDRPAPVISFVPRQRDLRELVSKAAAGNEVTSLFDTLKYWDGRFDSIRLDDRNLTAIVHQRLLKPKDEAARAALDQAFGSAVSMSSQAREILLDTHGERGSMDDFRLTYPFSPAFVHAMVDISGALQRERTALKLMQQLLVDYRDTLPVGQLMPLGAIFDVLAGGADRPFTDKLRDEFDTAKRFYGHRVRPYLLDKYKLTEEQARALGPKHNFRADDLIVKTLLLAALVPNVPALGGLTAARLAALNHGSIASMIPNQERRQVTMTLNALASQFGEIRLSGSAEDPRVDLALIGVDTEGIIRDNRHADDDSSRRRLVRDLLWKDLDLRETGTFDTRAPLVWRGTERVVEVLMDNVCDEERMPVGRFAADPGTIRMIIDYPFDEGGRFPSDDALRVSEIREQAGDTDTLIWLPHFLSEDRLADASTLNVINFLLERDRLTEVTPGLSADDRHHARTQLDSRRSALTARLRDALRRAYGVMSWDDADLGARSAEPVMALAGDLRPRLQLGQGLRGAFDRLCFALLDYRFPAHPDFDPNGHQAAVKPAELQMVVDAVEQATQDKVGRYEPPRQHIATLKKIANPLTIGVMHEQAFVLNRDWLTPLNRRAASETRITVGKLRGWIDAEQPGLPALVQNLLIVCYAIQTDKAWLRGERPVEAPALDRVADDMALRSQVLPTEEEFETASARAQGIFGIPRQPVRNARTAQALADAVRRTAAGRQDAARGLHAEFRDHAQTLGLDEGQPRMATSGVISSLLPRLAVTTDPTETVRVLAAADLPRENAFYQAHLNTADTLTTALRTVRWEFLDQFAASPDDTGASAIVAALRDAARRDEHEVPLAAKLREADARAIALAMSRMKPTEPPPPDEKPVLPNPPAALPDGPGTGPAPGPAPLEVHKVAAKNVAAFVEKICEAADEHQDAEFEIAWRIADR